MKEELSSASRFLLVFMLRHNPPHPRFVSQDLSQTETVQHASAVNLGTLTLTLVSTAVNAQSSLTQTQIKRLVLLTTE